MASLILCLHPKAKGATTCSTRSALKWASIADSSPCCQGRAMARTRRRSPPPRRSLRVTSRVLSTPGAAPLLITCASQRSSAAGRRCPGRGTAPVKVRWSARRNLRCLAPICDVASFERKTGKRHPKNNDRICGRCMLTTRNQTNVGHGPDDYRDAHFCIRSAPDSNRRND